jgi:predicted transcriptional regulator
MRYPNTRYGNPNEFAHYIQGRSIKDVAKHLKRSERTVRDWLNGEKKIPFWVPELLRLQHKERIDRLREMGMMRNRAHLNVVTATIHHLPKPAHSHHDKQLPEKQEDSINIYRLFADRVAGE